MVKININYIDIEVQVNDLVLCGQIFALLGILISLINLESTIDHVSICLHLLNSRTKFKFKILNIENIESEKVSISDSSISPHYYHRGNYRSGESKDDEN